MFVIWLDRLQALSFAQFFTLELLVMAAVGCTLAYIKLTGGNDAQS